MLTSAPGSKRPVRRPFKRGFIRDFKRGPTRGLTRGFTVIELLIVIAIVAVAVAVVSAALPDRDSARLEEEGARLAALLEIARAEARVAGVPVRWVPRVDADGGARADDVANFVFVGLPTALALPSRWLDARVSASVVGGTYLVLGPEAVLPAQRVELRLADKKLDLATDGLGPFSTEPVVVAAKP
jgi:general secretion pathway protein H